MTFQPLTILCGGLPAGGVCAPAEPTGPYANVGIAPVRVALALSLEVNF